MVNRSVSVGFMECVKMSIPNTHFVNVASVFLVLSGDAFVDAEKKILYL